VGLTTLPEGVGQLSALQGLGLRGCTGLMSLPGSIGQLVALEWLNLGGCSGLTLVPESVVRLTSLRTVYMYGCDGLQQLVVQWPAGCEVTTTEPVREPDCDDDIRLWPSVYC
jgi:hypothetical protein